MKYAITLVAIVVLCSCSKSDGERKHEAAPHLTATSAYRSWIEKTDDKFEYASAHIVNKRFSFVPDGPVEKGTAHHVVLLETFDLEDSMAHELGNGKIEVEAYPTGDKTDNKPLWAMNAIGRSGEIFRKLYKVQQVGCCENTDRDLYFSLKNGAEMFTSTVPVLLLHHVDLGQWRFIGYDAGTGENHPPEMESNKSIVGILTYGNGEMLSKRLAIISNNSSEYLCKAITLRSSDSTIQSRVNETTIFSTSKEKDFGGVTIDLVLEPREEGPALRLQIPIEEDNLAMKKVKKSSSLEVKLLN